MQSLLSASRDAGVQVSEQHVAIDEIRDYMARPGPRLVVALLDWDIVVAAEVDDGAMVCTDRPGDSYSGHFVVVVGCHDGRVYFHNPNNKQIDQHLRGASRSIPEALFDQARLAVGTDEDLLFVSTRST